MRAFVTGGTGLLGNNLVRALLHDGHEVLALARTSANADRELGVSFRPFTDTVTDTVAWMTTRLQEKAGLNAQYRTQAPSLAPRRANASRQIELKGHRDERHIGEPDVRGLVALRAPLVRDG
jgi:nucleoside-diphosphate-sugar epimerase